MNKRIIISLGGSLIVPGGIDTTFIREFKDLIERLIERGSTFILVTGGGKTARNYIDAASLVEPITSEDQDWLGIHATRMNAHLIRTIFRDHAYPRINTNPHDLEDFYTARDPILVAAGWRPGHSTDYDAVLIGKYLDANRIINLSDVDYVYDKDPNKEFDAKKFERMSWQEFRALVGDEWNPGMSSPFDPVAAKLAQEEGMEVAIMSGKHLENLEAYLLGKPFQGTVIRGSEQETANKEQ
jgi:uridylate kinase